MKAKKYQQIPRETVIQLITKIQMQNLTIEEIEDYVEDYDLHKKSQAEIEQALYEMKSYKYRGYSNGFLSELYHTLTNQDVEVIGEVVKLYPCDCCGLLSLDEKHGIDEGGWDICPYCNWEDTSIGTQDIYEHCSCNRGSIAQYRQHITDNPNIYYREKWYKGNNE